MRKFLANVLYIFMGLPLALSALMLLSVRPWALDRETYKRFVLDDRLYAALASPEAAARAPEVIEIDGASLDGKALVAAVQKNIPVAAVKAAGAGAIDSVMDGALSASAESASIDFKELKAALKGASPAVARDYVAALPVESLPPSATDLTYRPAAVGQKAASEAMAKTLASSLDRAIPDTALVPMSEDRPSGAMPAANRAKIMSQAFLNRTSVVTALFSGLFLLGLGALGSSTWGGRLARAGKYVLIPSIFVLGIGAVIAIPGGLILQNLMPREAIEVFRGEAGNQLRAYLSSSLGPIAKSFFITGLVGASVGGLLVSMRRIVEPKEIE